MKRLLNWQLTIVAAALFANTAAAHPVSLTRAFVHVTQEKVSAKIEIFLEDLFLFHNLKPSDQDFLEPDVIDQGIEKHKAFLLDRFRIRDVAGERLEGRIVNVEKSHLPPEGVPLAHLMAHKIVFEFEYEVGKKPEFLTFSQHFNDEKIAIPAEMRLIVKQKNSDTPEIATLKPDRPEVFRFDWDNPPLSPQASDEEWEAWVKKQKEETLGITSYSSVYSFLYIDDHEVRHEILVPLLTLEESVLISRDDDDFLDIPEQDAARQQIEAYFTSGNPIKIDGVEVKPVVQRCDFYGLDFKDFAVMSERRKVSIANARVGIILSYSTKGAPSSVRVTWDRFNDYVFAVDMVVYAYKDSSRVTLSRLGKNNVYAWQSSSRPAPPKLNAVNVELPPRRMVSLSVLSLASLVLLLFVIVFLKLRGAGLEQIAIATIVLVGFGGASVDVGCWEIRDPFADAPQVSNEQAGAIFNSLHKNTFRAFDYHNDSDIYDALAKSVAGELLNDLYLQIHRGLEMQEQGGAVSRIQEVKIIDGSKQPLPDADGRDERGFQYRCKWTVNGTVEHWGHIHSRTNEYEGLFIVEPRDDHWKITKVDVLDERRVDFQTSLRGLSKS